MTEEIVLSVVVGLISGRKDALSRCLRALEEQTVRSRMEIIVPYDAPVAEVVSLQVEFPDVAFICVDGLDTWAARGGASREHHDRLRTVGLRAAKGGVIALTEDHAHAGRRWGEEMLDALRRHPTAGAVGGAVDCDSNRILNWAVWFCDFGRYQSPLPEGRSEFVSDSNVAYRRSALDRVEPVWRNDYHETAVHWAMVDGGFELRNAPRAVVWQARGGLTLKAALRERFVWARSFAGSRARLVPPPKRWLYAVLSPLLPIVMSWRLWRITTTRGTCQARFVRALPLIVALQGIWAIGECAGYVTADPG
jgi:GT2 family glycosyltransferase